MHPRINSSTHTKLTFLEILIKKGPLAIILDFGGFNNINIYSPSSIETKLQ